MKSSLGFSKQFRRTIKSITGIRPGRLDFYELAFIHRSASLSELNRFDINNERLEYLGDSILDAIIADYLFQHYPGRGEGFLTQMRSKIVNRDYLDLLGRKLGLEDYLISDLDKKAIKKHLCGNALEALIGAVFLDKGYKKARNFVVNKILKALVDIRELEQKEDNYKSLLVELCQKRKLKLVFETGEESSSQGSFSSCAKIDDISYGTGYGYSKKEAEQKAARIAYDEMIEEFTDL